MEKETIYTPTGKIEDRELKFNRIQIKEVNQFKDFLITSFNAQLKKCISIDHGKMYMEVQVFQHIFILEETEQETSVTMFFHIDVADIKAVYLKVLASGGVPIGGGMLYQKYSHLYYFLDPLGNLWALTEKREKQIL